MLSTFLWERAVHSKELSGFKYQHDMVRDVLFDILYKNKTKCIEASYHAQARSLAVRICYPSSKIKVQTLQVELNLSEPLNQFEYYLTRITSKACRPVDIIRLSMSLQEEIMQRRGGDVKEKQQGPANDTNKVNVVVPSAGDGPVLSSSGGHMVEKVTESGNNKGTQYENVGQTPISSTGDPNIGTSYAKSFTGEPSRKSVNFRTLITLAGNGADVVVSLESILFWVKSFSDKYITSKTIKYNI
ncbi:hypothetical protein Tco_0012404 [Tanacetum coccineum]